MAEHRERLIKRRRNPWITARCREGRTHDQDQDGHNGHHARQPNKPRPSQSFFSKTQLTFCAFCSFVPFVVKTFVPFCGSKPDHSIRPALDVQRIDKTDVPRLSRHHHRVRPLAGAEEPHAFQ